jgi:Tol biopolymer transport system component
VAERSIPIPVPLTAYRGNELYPAFSPDGNQVVFTWNGKNEDNYDIYVRPIAEDRPVRLTTNPADDFNPAWSADGRTIAFLRPSSPGHIAVMTVPSSGGAERVLAEFFYNPAAFVKFPTRFLAWHPRLRQLVLAARGSADEPSALWAIDDSGQKRRLTSPPKELLEIGDLNPAFAPDGSSLLFTRGGTRFTTQLHLLSMDRNGMPVGEVRRLANTVSSAITPAWVSMSEIIFQRFLQTGLWRMSVDHNSEPVPLVFAGWWPQQPAYREGRLIYSSGRNDHDIWRLSLAAPDRLAHAPVRAIASTHDEGSAEISPDGTRIAFMSSRTGRYEVWVSPLDERKEAVQLTALDGRGSGTPTWSPDGRWIAFETRLEGRSDLFAVPADGGPPQQLTSHAADEVDPSWSRDGAWIYFSSNRSGDWQIWKLHWETRRELLVNSRGELRPVESPDGQYLYYVRRNRLWRTELRDGHEEKILPEYEIAYHGFRVLPEGLYIIAEEDDKHGEKTLLFRRSGAGAVVPIITLGHMFACCIDIRPDRRALFYTLAEEKGYDLVLVNNFK